MLMVSLEAKQMKQKAYTLAEATIVLLIGGVLAFFVIKSLNAGKIKEDAYLKAGKLVYSQLSVATLDMSRKYSKYANLTGLSTVNKSAVFEITDKDATDKLLALYKTSLKRSRKAASSTYSGYSGNFKLKNGTFFALKLYGNCSTTTTTYNPSYGSEAMYEYETCGAIFYDVNDNELPNTLGIDRYIIAFDKQGLR